MSTDIALIVQKLLLSIGEASIPGVGTLVLNRQGASYDRNVELIYPPSYTLEFKDSIKDGDQLLSYTSSYYNINKDTAKIALTNFSNLILQSLETHKYFELNGVGEFTLEQNQVLFTPNSNISNWYAKELLPIKPIKVNKTYPPLITENISALKKVDHTWRWLPLLFLLCLITILVKYNTNRDTESLGSKVKEDSIEIKDNLIKDSDQVTTEENPTTEQYVGTEKCVIITGYFTNASNIIKMTSKVENLGYEVFLEDVGVGTRVGIKFDCTNMDLKQKIYNIRDSVTKDAWYLQPSLKVE